MLQINCAGINVKTAPRRGEIGAACHGLDPSKKIGAPGYSVLPIGVNRIGSHVDVATLTRAESTCDDIGRTFQINCMGLDIDLACHARPQRRREDSSGIKHVETACADNDVTCITGTSNQLIVGTNLRNGAESRVNLYGG